uniref:Uncharacterized protein n=1 Tax=Meloidogyne enterolobii TaxID=390850 RepID=A0A6V7UQV6_MELEN|nr:unnamed protein product [Meloidogyne enterolobii]
MKFGSEKLNYLDEEISKESSVAIIKEKWLEWLGNDKTFDKQVISL